MSGGSFNYLCYAEPEDLLRRLGDLREMADALAAMGYARDAAAETEELICYINQAIIRIETRRKRLQDVWRDMEWWKSGDYSEAQFKEALAKYRGEAK